MINKCFNIPCSFEELNNRLATCSHPDELEKAIGLEELKVKPLSYSLFLQTVCYIFSSYNDINSERLGNLIRKMYQLFPNPTQEDARVAKIFFGMMKEKLNPSPKPSHSLVTGQCLNTKQSFSYSIEEFLNILQGHFQLSAETRLQQILSKVDTSSPNKKALQLQLLLNLLVLEEDFFDLIPTYVELALKRQNVSDQYYLGSHLTLNLSQLREASLFGDPSREVSLFEVPNKIEETEEFTFWLNVSPYLALYKEKEKLYVTLKPANQKDLRIPDEEMIEKFKKLKLKTQNEQIKYLIDKIFLSKEKNVLTLSLKKELCSITIFCANVEFSLLMKEKFDEHFEQSVIPYGYLLFNTVRKQLLEDFGENTSDPSLEKIHEIKKIINKHTLYRENQREIFNLVKKQLDQIIQKANKPIFSQFTKSLLIRAGEEKKTLRKNLFEDKVSVLVFPLISSLKVIDFPLADLSVATSLIESSPIMNSPVNLIASSPQPTLKSEKSTPKQELADLTKELGEPFSYTFDARVERWEQHPFGEPLPLKDFPDYQEQPLSYQMLMQVYHALNPMVNNFISLSIKSVWENKHKNKHDLRFVIPAEITFNKKKRRGFIAYGIDTEKNICYHKFFSEKIDADILSHMINKTFDEHDFPELQKAALSGRVSKTVIPVQALKTTVEIDPLFGNVIIQDLKKNIRIELFKTPH